MQVRGVTNDSMDQEYPNCKLYKTLALGHSWWDSKEALCRFKRAWRGCFSFLESTIAQIALNNILTTICIYFEDG
ncbi:hypothetical protein EYC80_004774 [Monilinia laxa]|uniref:Uncharacterized protein n=1 Tax=Monilinia laxa TaxID=61186 RepID=A0A5N6KIB1_MONLA|nr:hypothetical protein EYC80_004774 [Monilinia laxa]